MVVVPLYDTLGAEAITYIVNKGMLWALGRNWPHYRLDMVTLYLLIFDLIGILYLNVHLPFFLM